jgi:c-di-AMP phosphodiesterase-like protein
MPFTFIVLAIILVETLFYGTSKYVIFVLYTVSFAAVYALTIIVIYVLSLSESKNDKNEIRKEIISELKSTWSGAALGILFGLVLVMI